MRSVRRRVLRNLMRYCAITQFLYLHELLQTTLARGDRNSREARPGSLRKSCGITRSSARARRPALHSRRGRQRGECFPCGQRFPQARRNDDGWPSVFAEWLKGSRLNGKDAILVLSVGGGSLEKNVSPNLVSALQLAKERGSAILGIVGRDGGCTAQVADVAIVIPTVNSANVTPHTEAFQAVVWHLWISHPTLKVAETKWESLK